MAIQNFRTPLYTLWYRDNNGNKISYNRTNQNYTIVKNKIVLSEIPDEYYKVFINGLYEIHEGNIPNSSQFFVDYETGEVTFDSSHEGETVIVSSYYGRGIIYIFASRVISEYDEGNNLITETLADVANNFKFIGEYNSLTSYKVRNIVSYAGGSYICINPTVGNPPSNFNYWQSIAKPGLGLSYRGVYDNALTYNINDYVSYSDSFYICIQQSTGYLPTNNSYWDILNMPRTVVTTIKNVVTIGATPVSSIDVGIPSFNAINDDLTIIQNTTQIWEGQEYTISGTTINKISGTWASGTVFYIKVLKNLINDFFYTDGSMLQDGTVNRYKFTADVQEDISNLGSIGNVTALHTIDKSSVVNAINETYDEIGNLSNLNTSDKTSIVNGINSHLADNAYNLASYPGVDKTGVADNTIEIAAAITAAGNRTIRITSGTYKAKNITFPDNSHIIFENVIFVRAAGGTSAFIDLGENTTFEGILEINGSKAVYDASNDYVGLQISNNGFKSLGYINLHDHAGHGIRISGDDVFIKAIKVCDNGENPGVSGTGDGIYIVNAERVTVENIFATGNSRMGVTVTTYAEPMDNTLSKDIILDNVYANSNSYNDVDTESTSYVTINKIRGWGTVAASESNNCQFFDLEVSKFYANNTNYCKVIDIKMKPPLTATQIFLLVGKNPHVENLYGFDTATDYGTSYYVTITDSVNANAVIKNITLEKAYSGINATGIALFENCEVITAANRYIVADARRFSGTKQRTFKINKGFAECYFTANPSGNLTGTWLKGDKMYVIAPISGGYIGWVCIADGTPDANNWKQFGAIA
jgi:hypothetical protein